MVALRISVYIAALVFANFVVHTFGKTGLVFTAFVLIPFDFVMRSWFHETWKGADLLINMFLLISSSALFTYLLNPETKSIAMASAVGFIAAQALAGVFYQLFIKHDLFLKVNGSDLVGIVVDSVAFQWIAFGAFDWAITWGQILMKFLGGLIWFWVIFKLFKFHKRW